MYFVAFWDDWCSTVPKSWVEESQKLIKWPPKNENPTTACKKGTNPKSNWQSVKYTKLLGPYKNYDTAREVEIAAVDLSTSDEASFMNATKSKEVLPKRPRKPPARYRQSTDDNDSRSDNETEDGTLNNDDKVPKINFHYEPINNINNIEDDILKDTQPLDNGNFLEDPAYISLKEQGDKNVKECNVKIIEGHRNDDDSNNNNEIQEQESTSGHDNAQFVAPVCQNCCPACRLKLDQMSRKLDIVLMYMKSNYSTQISPTTLLNALPEFTVKNEKMLEQFNKTLTDSEEARTQYAKLITLRGVSDGKKHVREVLAYILDDDFSCKLSWSGQKKTIAVKDMKFTELLISTIINSNPRSTISEVNAAIKSWLQHASDRVKYIAKKHQTDN